MVEPETLAKIAAVCLLSLFSNTSSSARNPNGLPVNSSAT